MKTKSVFADASMSWSCIYKEIATDRRVPSTSPRPAQTTSSERRGGMLVLLLITHALRGFTHTHTHNKQTYKSCNSLGRKSSSSRQLGDTPWESASVLLLHCFSSGNTQFGSFGVFSSPERNYVQK